MNTRLLPTPSEFILGTKIELDASNTSKAIGIKVSNASAANILDMAVSISNLAVVTMTDFTVRQLTPKDVDAFTMMAKQFLKKRSTASSSVST